jgi:Tol biopolymer transport system component
MKPIRLLLLAVISILVCGACELDYHGETECDRIAFAMADYLKEQNPDIYTICPDGSQLTQLTDNPAFDSDPAWSPDNMSIAFTSTRTGVSQVYLMNADGSEQKQLTFDMANDKPIWLPDGKRIAYRTTDGAGLWWWQILSLDNQESEPISTPSYDFFYQTPAWSPDGKMIAYMSLLEQQARNDGSSQIHIKKLDGSDDRALTHNIWANVNPVWSPDGEQIVFLSEQHGEYNIFALYVMRADGHDVRQLSEPIFTDTGAIYSWSPDGSQIVVGDIYIGHLYLYEINSRERKEITQIPEGKTLLSPAWQN